MATSNNLGLYLPVREDYISVKRDLSDNYEVIDAAVGELDVIINGNTASVNVTSGQFVTVINSTITGITDGIYKATANVSAGTAFTSSNLQSVTSGALNDLNSQISTLNGKMTIKNYGSSSSATSVKNHIIGMMDDVIADTTFPTSAYCPIIKTLQGQDEYSGIAMKFDSSHGQLIVWDSSNHMYRCIRNGNSRYVGEFTGTNM